MSITIHITDSQHIPSMLQCPAGFHQPAAASVFCVPCDAGTSSNGITGAAACTRCPAGTASSTGSATCTPCSAGEYQPSNNSDTCMACTAGKFQDVIGAMTCKECPSGREQPNLGADKCDECQVQLMCYELDCVLIESHTQSSTTHATQTGMYAAIKGSSICIPCSSPFTTSSTGATRCDACETGSFKDQNDICHTCPEGVKCNKPVKLETLELESGYFRATPESTEVYPCTLGETACQGGDQTGDDLCFEGYQGPLCDM